MTMEKSSTFLWVTELHNTECDTDVTIICPDGSVPFHKCILAAVSPCLKQTFSQEKDEVILLPDITFRAIKHLKELMYNGTVVLKTNDLQLLTEASCILQMPTMSCSIIDMPTEQKTVSKRKQRKRKFSEAMDCEPSTSSASGGELLIPLSECVGHSGFLSCKDDVPKTCDAAAFHAMLPDGKTLEMFEVEDKRRADLEKANIRSHQEQDCDYLTIQEDCDTSNDSEYFFDTVETVLSDSSIENEFDCYYCCRVFQTADELKEHEYLCNSLKCNLCQKVFLDNQIGLLHKHNREVHNIRLRDTIEHQCRFCSSNFETVLDLKAHRESAHPRYSSYVCEICSEVCKDRLKMEIHLRKHNDERPFKCKFCYDTFISKESVSSHIARKHDPNKQKYPCEFCGQLCTRRHLIVHLTTHTKKGRVTCKICESSFQTPSFLKRHMLIHTGEKPFKCQICNYAANQKSAVKTHMKVHNKNQLGEGSQS